MIFNIKRYEPTLCMGPSVNGPSHNNASNPLISKELWECVNENSDDISSVEQLMYCEKHASK